MAPQGMEREIGCRSVGVGMGEPAGHLPWPPGGLADRRFSRSLDCIMKGFEALPGDRGLESVRNDGPSHQTLAGIGHPDKGVSPHPCRPFAMRIGLVRV